MTLYPNQFSQEVVQGQLDQAFNPNTLSCRISANETATLVPGSPVKLEDSVGGVPNVLLCTADSDTIFGFVTRNNKKSTFEDGDEVEISIVNNVMYMTAGAAIARGAMLEADVSEAEVITNAGNPICGFAYDKASAQGDLIRVYILSPGISLTTPTFGNTSITGTLGVVGASTFAAASFSGDVTLAANLIKSHTDYSAGAGALPITTDIIFLTTGGAEALTLADGVAGQELKIVMVVDGGDGTLTPANYLNGTTLTFDDAGDSAHLVFDGTNWCNVGTPTATVA